MASRWHLIASVRNSTYRERTLLALSRQQTPAELHRAIKGISRQHITRALRQLETLKLVKCLSPETPRYHLYQRTNLGNQIARAIKDLR